MSIYFEKLPKEAVEVSPGLWNVNGRRYMKAFVFDEDTGQMSKSVFHDIRYEVLDPTPLEIPVALKRPESTDQRIKRLMTEQREWEKWAKRVDEGEIDLEDFDPDDPSPYTSKYQAWLDLKNEMKSISDDDVEDYRKSKMGHNKGPKMDDDRQKKSSKKDDDQLDIEDITEDPKQPPKRSTKNVDNFKE